MREWFFPILITTVFSVLIPIILPKGEKSPLYPPLKLLLSLALTLSVLSPLISFCRDGVKNDFHTNSIQFTEEDGNAIILQKAEEDIKEAVTKAFPGEEILLELATNEENIPTGIRFTCQTVESGKRISDFLEKNFSLIATYTVKEETV